MKNKNNYVKYLYPILIFIATLFMGIGYARVNDQQLFINGKLETNLPKEVLITSVDYSSNMSADVDNSKINYFAGTLLDSEIVLGNNGYSTITYNISVYNNSNSDQVFIETITDLLDHDLYSNPNIEFSLSGIEEYQTVLSPKDSLTFQITFSYKNNTVASDHTLVSKLNFRFKEVPKIFLSNENTTSTVSDAYPGNPKKYSFNVANYNDSEINSVPLKYSFETTMNAPFTLKVVDEGDNEVTNKIELEGDSQTTEKHNYKFVVDWENIDDNFDYSQYEGKEFNGQVILKAIPEDSEKYLDYVIIKKFNVKVALHWTDQVVPVINIKATKVTSKTEVASDNWSDEGLNFKINLETAGDSGATIYYCKDTTNTCNPNIVATSGLEITTYNNLANDKYYIRYKAVSGQGVVSNVQTYIAKVDNVVPTIKMLTTGSYELDLSSNIVSNVTKGISGATYTCVDEFHNMVTTINSINRLGSNNVSCTITSGAGKTYTLTKEYKISHTLLATDSKIGLTNGAYRNGSSIILPFGGIQYGPYMNASKGCYRAFYFGNNLNAYAQGYSVIATYNGVATVINLSNLNYVSSDSNYYFELTQDATKLETKLTNNNSAQTITINSFRIQYEGPSCP